VKVAILMGSDSDLDRLQPCITSLRELEIPFEARVMSAHRTPGDVVQFVEAAQSNEIGVFICAAGGAAHLAGVVAAHTDLPVLCAATRREGVLVLSVQQSARTACRRPRPERKS